jgi:hypothetical protein
MQISFTGTREEIEREMTEFLGYVIVEAPAEQPATAPKIESQAAPKAEKPKKAPKAEKAPAPAQEPAEVVTAGSVGVSDVGGEPVAAAVATFPPATLDEARGAIARLVSAKGIESARALLARFGAKRAQDVKPEQLGELYDKADRAAAGKYDPLAAE